MTIHPLRLFVFGRRRLYFYLSSIFAVSIVLRYLYLGNNLPGLYNDELYFLLSAYAQLYHIGNLTVPGYNLTDFTFYIINGYIPSIILFGANPFSARFPVAMYGSLIVFPIYLVANELIKNRKIALMAALFWAISPSAVVTSRVGYGVEIFPLFLFLFFVFFWLKFLNSHHRKYFVFSLPFTVIIIFFSSVRVWALIPLTEIIIFTILPKIRSRLILKRHENTSYVEYMISFFIAVSATWVGLLYAPLIFSALGYSVLLGGISKSFLLVNEPFPRSVLEFFIRIAYALAPWKMFWFGEFTPTALNYGSPVFVPSMFLFTLPFFYGSIFCIPHIYRKNKNVMNSYYLLIGLMLFGLTQPVFNITNPYFNFEPSEGIFALPSYSILTAFSFCIFLSWIFESLREKRVQNTGNINPNSVMAKNRWHQRTLAAVLIVAVILFANINVESFVSDLYVSSTAYYQNDNASLNYMFYGWNHVSDYLVENHLYNETLYYTPGKEGPNNLTNNNNFNYWFFHQNFPLYWLYTYSGGKITAIDPLHTGSLPPVPKNTAIVLSQNASYPQLLSANDINNTILYRVHRADGKPAIEVIQIRNTINALEKSRIRDNSLFNETNITGFEAFSLSTLTNLSSQITVSIKFSIPAGELQPGREYSLFNSLTPTFSLGMWPQNMFVRGEPNTSFVPVGAIYTDYGNYSAPNTWQRLYGNVPLAYNTTYMLTMTFNNGSMYLYLNGTLIGTHQLDYPLYPLTPSILYIDYNINATVAQASIWGIALNAGEIGYMNWRGLLGS
ncbi:MAG: hypothetical protein M1351_00030 [Candidatus Thermoplasmatota archaeon]|nr:hypothetical protein [Candidatus Thermoplasmatota archaeon]